MIGDSRRVDLSGKTLIKAKMHGHRFEIIVDPELALKYRQGNLEENVAIHDILEIDIIFQNASKGEKAPDDVLIEVFGTTDIDEVAKVLLEKGDINLTAEQRQEIFGQKRRKLVNLISKVCINPKTRTPHPPARIENAMKEAKISIDPIASPESQMKDIIKKLRSVLPISMETVRMAIRIPPEFTGKAYGEIKREAQIEKEEWTSDGYWIAVVSIPAGMQPNFVELVQNMTKGRADIKVLERIQL